MPYIKNLKFLSLANVTYIDKYIKELLNICFEYASIFTFNYNLNSFKNMCLYNINTSVLNMHNISYLINLYLEKDYFYSNLFSLVNLKAKLTLNQIFQSLNIKGIYSDSNSNIYLFSNLYYGLNLKDLIYSSFSARNSIIDSSLNTSESGYLTRKLVESLRDVYLKCNKCFSKYTYKNVYKNVNFILPFLCSDNKSICMKCICVNYNTYLISGYSKGTISGQALGEPSTQMLLRTFHLGDKLNFKNLLCSSKVYLEFISKFIKSTCYKYYGIMYNKNNYISYNTNYLNYICTKYPINKVIKEVHINLLQTSLIKILNNLWGCISLVSVNYLGSSTLHVVNNNTYSYTLF
uniref:DNA-directed RNA polymerase n=2 Tax=Babesia TaxID=5864 RepID=A0A411ADA8_9APIC|nr:RpoC2a [Babesia sp. Lintan]QAX27053.1 RpoC2a [Babesia motasi]QAX27084.1 RpoC2a [Babesia motasi]